jgi:hypothetical protein
LIHSLSKRPLCRSGLAIAKSDSGGAISALDCFAFARSAKAEPNRKIHPAVRTR